MTPEERAAEAARYLNGCLKNEVVIADAIWKAVTEERQRILDANAAAETLNEKGEALMALADEITRGGLERLGYRLIYDFLPPTRLRNGGGDR